MYKGRWQVWFGSIAACFAILLAINGITSFAHFLSYSVDVTVQTNVSVDNMFTSHVNRSKTGDYYYTIGDNPDIIFQDSSDETKLGYTKYPQVIHTGLVMYVRNTIVSNNSGFIPTTTSTSTYKPYRIDLLSVLEAMENNDDWKSLNVSNKVVKGKVKLYIPQESDPWYPAVEELFYITVNNGKTPNEQERESLELRVGKLLDMCIKIPSITQGVMEEYKNPSSDYKVFIGPECIDIEGNAFHKSNKDAFVNVYFLNTVCEYVDIFVKDDPKMADYMTSIKTNSSFSGKTGWRVKDYTYDIGNISYRWIDFY